MRKWIKILSVIIGIIFLVVFILRQIYLSPDFVDQPILTSSLQTKTISVDNINRTFQWYSPKEKKDINSILYVLHGSRSSGEEVRKSMAYEFDKIADEEGIVVVYPTGFENHWNDCRGSADYSANTLDIDDFNFFQELEVFLEKELKTQLQYRFATGHSNGGHMCYKLALEHPEWIDAIAPISANLPIVDNLDCGKAGIFVPICLINGTDDPINPYQGGLVEIMGNTSRGTVLSTDETMDYWTGLGDCSSPQIIEQEDKISNDNSTIVQSTWHCDSALLAINYQIVNGGHVIPHPKNKLPKILGTTNQDLNAPQAIWEFFKKIKKSKGHEKNI